MSIPTDREIRELHAHPPRFVTAAAYQTAVLRFGADKATRFVGLVARYGEPDLPA